MINYRDPIQLVAEFLIDPRLMIVNKKEIKLNYCDMKDSNNNNCYGDLFTSKFAKDNEEYIKQRHPRNLGLFLYLILYWDGVNVADIGNVNVDTVMVSLGNFSDKLMTQNITKTIICYLPTLNAIETSTVSKHLQQKVGYTKTEVKNN